jgi:alkylhydroperoxidase family enzyme
MRYARLRFGRVPEPMTRWADHGGVFWAWSLEETVVEGFWRALPVGLRMLAVLKSASTVDCPWCLDYGSHVSEKSGLPEVKLRSLHRWRDSDVYDDTERDVLAYAEGVSSTPVVVDDALTRRLEDRLGRKGLVELTALVALENQRSRFNAAMGVLPQGWSRVCALATPVLATPATTVAGQEVAARAAKSSG